MKSNLDIAKEILEGKWGNGADRRKRLAEDGYNYDDVQGIVNALLTDSQYEPVDDNSDVIVLGNETMEIDVNLSKYKALKLNFSVK